MFVVDGFFLFWSVVVLFDVVGSGYYGDMFFYV